jgi:hypothetical protein
MAREVPMSMTIEEKKQAILETIEREPKLIPYLHAWLEHVHSVQIHGAGVIPALRDLLYPPDGSGFEVERFVVAAFDTRSEIVDIGVLHQGGLDSTPAEPSTVFRWALTRRRAVSQIVIAHNHPSGNVYPSDQDVEMTRNFRAAGDRIGIEVVDSYVIGPGGYTSVMDFIRNEVSPTLAEDALRLELRQAQTEAQKRAFRALSAHPDIGAGAPFTMNKKHVVPDVGETIASRTLSCLLRDGYIELFRTNASGQAVYRLTSTSQNESE